MYFRLATWSSKKQSCVAFSYQLQNQNTLLWPVQLSKRQLTAELGSSSEAATTIYEDNQSAISMTKNQQVQGKAKHIAIKYHFIHKQVSNGLYNLNITLQKKWWQMHLLKVLVINNFASYELFNYLKTMFKSEEQC